MPLDDPLYGCEADTCPLVFTAMQSLKDGKQFIFILHIKACSVVFDTKDLFPLDIGSLQLDSGSSILAGIFPGIPQQVLQHYPEQGRIPFSRKV